MTDTNPDTGVQRLREALSEYDLRIEFSTALSISGAHPCAFLSTKRGNGRWAKTDLPAILPPEGGNRADLLRLFADLLDPA